jgi:hypothetical protein
MSKIGRNEPCSCGSGKKFKHCHGAPVKQESEAESLAVELLGPHAGSALWMLDSFAAAATPRSYRIMPHAEYALVEDVAERNQIYCQEILFRAHFGASAGLMRLREWMHGSIRSLRDKNVLMLAAGLRGLLEAAADTWQAFEDVPLQLAGFHAVFRDAVRGKMADRLVLAGELENSVIHFAYARKLKDGDSPRLHNAETARDSISRLVEAAPTILDAYAMLCEYSHPAASSVFRFAQRSVPNVTTFDPIAGAADIREILASSQKPVRTGLDLGIGILMMTLKVLNAFSFAPVATPWADDLSDEAFPGWQVFQRVMAAPVGPAPMSSEDARRHMSEIETQYQPFGKGKPGKKR